MIRKIDHVLLAVFMAAGLMMAGCLDLGPRQEDDGPRYTEDKRPPLGLGLEVPASLPPPGPFVEGSELQPFEGVIRDLGSDIVVGCGRPGLVRWIDESIRGERHNNAINTILSMCRVEVELEDVNKTQESAMERRLYPGLLDNATRAVHNATRILTNHPGPGNAVEAQFLAMLMDWNYIEHRLLDRDVSVWQEYENATLRNVEDLRKGFRNLGSAINRSATLSTILEHYPWSDPPCVSPDVRELSERINKTIEQIHLHIDLYGGDIPGAPDNNSRAHNRFLDTLVPQYEFARDKNWWPLLLSVDSLMSGNIAYWESYSHPAWPTLEEAEFMLAQHRHEGRSIWTDGHLDHYVGYFRSPELQELSPWETELNFGPPDLLGALAMHWPFGDLECPGSSESYDRVWTDP